MKIQQIIISETVKLTLLPATYSFEIDGEKYQAEDEEPYDDREEMIEAALEQIAIQYAENHSEDEHDALLDKLHKLEAQLIR